MDYGEDTPERLGHLLGLVMKRCPLTLVTAEDIVNMSGVTWDKYNRTIERLGLQHPMYFTWPQVIQILEALRA